MSFNIEITEGSGGNSRMKFVSLPKQACISVVKNFVNMQQGYKARI